MCPAINSRQKVLFLCTGNSCRSQIAEAIVRERCLDAWEAYSAGTHPAGYVHPLAIKVLSEWGINWNGRSKSSDEFRSDQFDLVVTVCDSAAEECPVWLGSGKKIHHSFSDPAKATGSPEEILEIFRQVRNQIAAEIPPLLSDCE